MDASGTNTYTCAVGGGREILGEDGPWSGTGDVPTVTNRQGRSHGAGYRYDSYGRLIASSGTPLIPILMRFSSQPWHDHSETYYYGYRFYLPE
ncbi:MAG TPA: hypothetical protein PKE47_05375, partial [Verrucomicrobiota bacterium]|nr:hypothetical protein [Verrucomicrobiota bacterium]